MIAEKGKISVRQLYLILIMIFLSPGIRLIPREISGVAKQASWLSPIVAFAGIIIFIFIIDGFFKNNKELNFADIINKITGNVIGRIISVMYLMWIFLLISLYFRYYSERMLSSILPNTSIHFYLIIMTALVFYVARNGLVAFARVNETLLLFILVVFFVLIFFALFNIEIDNLLPISTKDILPVIKGSTNILGLWGYLIILFFLGDKVNQTSSIKKIGIKTFSLVTIITTSIIIVTIGPMSHNLTKKVPVPFFVAIKNVSIGQAFERFESLIIAIWTVTDFFLITVLVFAAVSIIKSLFKLKDSKILVTPIVLAAYPFTSFLTNNSFELERFSSIFILPLNYGFEFLVPIVLFIIGKVRKVI